MNTTIKRLLFFWTTSFALATVVYYLLWAIMPNKNVFGALFRMFLYHQEHPIAFIAIPCFFYGIIATLLAKRFSKQSALNQVILTIVILVLTVLLSSPIGGMLWCYYDMKAGFFPGNWVEKMIQLGFQLGLEMGWLVVMLSIPYNIIGSIVCYFLTKVGSRRYGIQQENPYNLGS